MCTGKIMTRQEFQNALTSVLWEHKVYYGQESCEIDNDVYLWTGWVECISTLGDIDIHHYGEFQYEQNEPESFRFMDDIEQDQWRVTGINVVDNEGNTYDSWELASLIPESFHLERNFDKKKLNILAYHQLGSITDKKPIHHLKWKYKPIISFNGELLSSVATQYGVNKSNNYYSGSFGRWDEYKIFKTSEISELKKSLYIVEHHHYTHHDNEENKVTGQICSDDREVMDFLETTTINSFLKNELLVNAMVNDLNSQSLK